MALSPNPARLLTSREVAKITVSFLGAMMNQTEKGSVSLFEVLDHLAEHKESYKKIWQDLERMLPEELR